MVHVVSTEGEQAIGDVKEQKHEKHGKQPVAQRATSAAGEQKKRHHSQLEEDEQRQDIKQGDHRWNQMPNSHSGARVPTGIFRNVINDILRPEV